MATLTDLVKEHGFGIIVTNYMKTVGPFKIKSENERFFFVDWTNGIWKDVPVQKLNDSDDWELVSD